MPAESGGRCRWTPRLQRLGSLAMLGGLAILSHAAGGAPQGGLRLAAAGASFHCVTPVRVGGLLRCGLDDPRWRDREELPLGQGWCAARLAPGDTLDCDSGSVRRGRLAPDEIAALGVRLRLNEASAKELETISGVGPRLAARMISSRPFEQPGDVRRVPGIGPRKTSAIADRVCVDCAAGIIAATTSAAP